MQLKLSSDEGWPMPWADTPWPNCLVLIPGACFLWLLPLVRMYEGMPCPVLRPAMRSEARAGHHLLRLLLRGMPSPSRPASG